MRDGMKPEFEVWGGSGSEGGGVVYSAWNGTKKALGMADDSDD